MSSFEASAYLVVTFAETDAIELELEDVRDRSYSYGDVAGMYRLSIAEAKTLISRLRSVRKASSRTIVGLADLVLVTNVGHDNYRRLKRDLNTIGVSFTSEISISLTADSADALADVISLTLEERSLANQGSVKVELQYNSKSDERRYLIGEEIQTVVQTMDLTRT